MVCLVSEWCTKYRNQKVDSKMLQKEIDKFMESHDQRIENVSPHKRVDFVLTTDARYPK